MAEAAQKIEQHTHIHVAPGEWVRQDLLQPVFGISTEAARKYRTRGLWKEGVHWKWDPANVIVYSPKAIGAWLGGKIE